MHDKRIEPIILVHGTGAGPVAGVVKWYQPGSCFCTALDQAFEELNIPVRCWQTDDYFHWGPGKNTWLARREAADRLRAFLQKRKRHYHIVAHSHGGNIVLEALDWDRFGSARWFSGTVTLLGTPLLLYDRPYKSYTKVLLALLLLAFSAGVYHTQSFPIW